MDHRRRFRAQARYARRPQGPAARRDMVAVCIRAVFWEQFSKVA
jgi:hypothetical protein